MRCYYSKFKIFAILATIASVIAVSSAPTRAITVGIYSDTEPAGAELTALNAITGFTVSPIFSTGDLVFAMQSNSFNVFYVGSTYGTTLDSIATDIDTYVSGGGRLVIGQQDSAGAMNFLPTGFEATVDSTSAPTGGFTLTGSPPGPTIFSGLSATDLGTDSEDTILSSSLGGSWTELATTGALSDATGMAIGDYGSGRMLLWPDRFDGAGAPSSQLIDQAFEYVLNGVASTVPALTTSPVDSSTVAFGNVRIGSTSSAMPITASNTGEASSLLNGSFPLAPGEFSPGSALAFNNLATTDAAVSRDYFYSPTDRTADSTGVSVTSDGGNSSLTLTGDGVGPEFESAGDTSGEFDFGSVNVGDMSSIMQLTITNNSPDGDLGNLTDLSLLAAGLTGANSDQFTFENFSVQELSTGNSLILDFKFVPTSGGLKTATFTLETDQTAAFGADGDDFMFTLTGNAIGASSGPIPEPSSLLMALLGAMFVLRRRRR